MKDAVIALGMGGPSKEGDVETFLFNLLSDRDLINFHLGGSLQRGLARYISKLRTDKVKPRYRAIGGGSPQLRHTEELLAKVKELYHKMAGRELDIFIGMCYFHPYVEDTVNRIAESGDYRALYLFPLYPQYCFATTGIAFKRFYKAVEKFKKFPETIRIDHYHNAPSFISAAAKRIISAGKAFSAFHILYSAHSIPMSLEKKGDPYTGQIKECSALITDKVKPSGARVGFQSRVGFARWLKPTTYEVLEEMAAEGIKDIVVYPISFINDHIETLYDVDVDLSARADKLGLNMARAEVFNSDDDFAGAAAEILMAHAPLNGGLYGSSN
jgi:ferrochelatase